MLNFTTLIQQCHTLFQHTKLCMLDSLREDETWPCIFPSAITLRPPAHAQGALPSLLHSIRACAGMQTLKRSPPHKPLRLLNKRVFQLSCSQTWSGCESKFHVALEKNRLVDRVMLRTALWQFWWLS